jgi:NAD(P)-dependent dehydrogenase (short-subunit alcohol dehydrogenase family)
MQSNISSNSSSSKTLTGRLESKVALITGGAGGMGRAASLQFAAAGAKVAILDIDKVAGESTVTEITENGGAAAFIATDVSKSAEVDYAIARVIEAYGPITVLFNHAGTRRGRRRAVRG